MFILHSSNKTENLLEHLAIVLKSAPLSTPFEKEVFLIQSQGMERWLSQQLARHFKVWGNFCYLFPGKFFSNLSGRLQPAGDETAFDRHRLLWRIEALLRQIDADVFKPLQHYLRGEQVELKRFQLAQELVGIFDQYQMLRPELLEAWRQNRSVYQTESEAWQCALWQGLLKELGSQHRGESWRQSILCLQQAESGQFSQFLPERISVFGISTMPPLLLAYLQALSRHCDVHLYLLNPVQGYWADLPGKRLLAQLAEFDGHPLLVGLGQQGREFQQLLLEMGEFEFEPSSFQAGSAGSNVQILQNDILANRMPQTRLQVDGTLSIHACHSRWREVQILKQQLLETLENEADLELRDIVVMAADIQLYAPFIGAVFADIQHSIADRSLRADNPAMNVLLDFLNVSQSRLGWQSVLDLLEQPLVYSGFGLTAADMELIRYWIADTHVRWGRSAAHKQALGLPALQQNTWQATLDRLFMGYAVGSDEAFVDAVLPYLDIEGSASQALGGLDEFLQLLFKAADELRTSKTLCEWQAVLARYADRLLGGAEPAERQPVSELLAEMDDITAIHRQPVSLAAMLAWLDGRMDESKSSGGFLRGQLTFCSMLPMRSIPFQVIALLGMNDGEFPRIERSAGFDLLMQQPRLGDRSRRADDRYQFLEVLMSARRRLIITYIGLSQRDNSEVPPSVIVSELLEVLRDSYQLDNLPVRHPLHPFSSRYFNGEHARLFSYEQYDLAIVRQLGQPQHQPAAWWQGSIPPENDTVVGIADLLQFFSHPQRHFLRQQLGVGLPQPAMENDEREPFALDGLERYLIQQQWVAEALAGNPPPLAQLQARGLWPAGALGELEWRRQRPGIERFVEAIQARALGATRPALAIDLTLGGYRLSGKLNNRYADGSLFYRYSTLKGGDFMVAWLHHLLVNQLEQQTTYLLGKDRELIFRAEIADAGILLELVDIYLQGRQRPDAFFTQAAFYYLQQPNPDTALDAVIRKMRDSIEKGYEPEIGQLLLNQDLNAVFNNEFVRQCEKLLQPAWSAAHGC
ncbi:MAG: exodeoxyribonuclease V subunit gamma [Methylococcales bacterium]|nr:exodeoxyribonuclease V subunit gamma [Methylococcales bacterium]